MSDLVTVKAETLAEVIVWMMGMGFTAGQRASGAIDMFGYDLWVDGQSVRLAGGDFKMRCEGFEPEELDLVRTFAPRVSQMLGGGDPAGEDEDEEAPFLPNV